MRMGKETCCNNVYNRGEHLVVKQEAWQFAPSGSVQRADRWNAWSQRMKTSAETPGRMELTCTETGETLGGECLRGELMDMLSLKCLLDI